MTKLRKELEQLTTEQLKRLTTSIKERLNSPTEVLSKEERNELIKKYNTAFRIIFKRTAHVDYKVDLGDY